MSNNFLACTPTVFIVEKHYEILVCVKKNGLVRLLIDGKEVLEQNSGVLSSEKKVFKFKVNAKLLDKAKSYTVLYRQSIDRKSYWSIFGETKEQTFAFKPISKDQDINAYMIADVHALYDLAYKTGTFFKNAVDLFIFNGDICEVQSHKDYLKACAFIGKLTKGKIPCIYTRGNHDTRGRLPECFDLYFPCVNKNFFYTFEIGAICGVVLDFGEDKVDTHDVYRDANRFSEYRRKEYQWLKKVNLPDGKIKLAICHVCPVMTTFNKGDEFDIERPLYQKINAQLERLNVDAMLCGHMHKAYMLYSGDEQNTLEHKYPVVVGSDPKNDFIGTAITITKNQILVKFTDCNHKVIEQHTITL